jgi:surface antigen
MKALLIITVAAACVAAQPAAAQNWIGLLKNTPAERFDEEDLRMFLDAARKARNDTPDKQTVTWENPKTRAHGEITVLRTFQSKGLPCKEVRIRNEAGGRKGTPGNVSLCKLEDKWRLLSLSPVKN